MSGLRGLYAITDPRLTGGDLFGAAEAAIAGGIHLLQYRNKTAPRERQIIEARELARLCQSRGVLFLVNDDPRLAREAGADGVHLGQSDAGIRQAREQLGAGKIIGRTCHASLEAALEAQEAGADYVAFGRFFASKTKPHAPPADIEILQTARQRLSLPIAAIGGITPENGGALIEAGADMLAVIHGIFGAADVELATRRFTRLFD